jgi:hypothetical protein
MNEGVVISGDERWLVTMRIEGGGEEGRGRASTQNNSESYFSLLTNFNIYSQPLDFFFATCRASMS